MKPVHITFLTNLASELDIFMPATAETLIQIANEETMANLGVSPLDIKKPPVTRVLIDQVE